VTYDAPSDVARRILTTRDGRHLLLLTDFDGTISDFVSRPDAAVLSPGRRDLLDRLAHAAGVTVGVVSGRRMSDVQARAPLGGEAMYAGLHGLEIRWRDRTIVHPGTTEAEGLLRVIRRALEALTTDLAGVVIEDKAFSLALHVRAARPEVQVAAEALFFRVATPHLQTGTLKLMRGSCVFELLPNIGWNKGNAVIRMCREAEDYFDTSVWPVYFGDDVTDEDAFAAIGDRGLSIVVGARESAAHMRLADTAAVEAVLRHLDAELVRP
jgi:trehalose-phosphatase